MSLERTNARCCCTLQELEGAKGPGQRATPKRFRFTKFECYRLWVSSSSAPRWQCGAEQIQMCASYVVHIGTGTVFVADHISSSTCYASKARIDKRTTFCMLEVEMRCPFVTLIMPALFTLAEAREMWSQATCGSCGLAAPWMQRWVTLWTKTQIDPIDPTCNHQSIFFVVCFH
jgi:hypothetical protein